MGRLNKTLANKQSVLEKAVLDDEKLDKKRDQDLKERRENRWKNEADVEQARKLFYNTGSKTRQMARTDHAYTAVPSTSQCKKSRYAT